MLISIIVPIYNVEKYLRKCIDSLINQTYSNIEIILINDGSTDNCLSICNDYSIKDSRIIIIDKPNGGLSDARNAGTKIAKGDYILYVDSDDYLELSACEELASVAKSTRADYVCFGFKKVNENGLLLNDNSNDFYCSNLKTVKELSFYEAIMDNMHKKHIAYTAWLKLYSKELAKSVQFPKGMLAEDFATFYLFLKNAKKIIIYDSYLYNYMIRDNSIMTSKSFKLYNDIFLIEKDYNNFILNNCMKKEDLLFNNSRHFRTLFKCLCVLYSNDDYYDTILKIKNEIISTKFSSLFFKEKVLKVLFTLSNKLTICLLKKIYF